MKCQCLCNCDNDAEEMEDKCKFCLEYHGDTYVLSEKGETLVKMFFGEGGIRND